MQAKTIETIVRRAQFRDVGIKGLSETELEMLLSVGNVAVMDGITIDLLPLKKDASVELERRLRAMPSHP